jgi:hypothetical protein
MLKEKYVDRTCRTHGLTEYVLDYRNSYRCKKCRVDAVTKRRRVLKLKAVEYKGGKCQRCGYSKCVQALQFHHTDDNKEFTIARKGVTRSWEKVKKEIDKCMLVCANCHAEIHAEKYNV